MNQFEQSKFEFGQTSWRQSIAVNITAQIIWVIVPIVFVCSIIIFSTLEKYQSQILSYKLDALTYRISNVIYNKVNMTDVEKGNIINKIAADLGFSAIEVEAQEYRLKARKDTSGYEAATSTLPFSSKADGFDNSFMNITSYHTPLNKVIEKQRKNILAVILMCLVAFSVFLVFSIRKWLYKPLKNLVDATEAVANSNTSVNLDTQRKDEFGHLSSFFMQMINNLNQQHKKLRQAAEVAKEANSAKSDFLANMSHELRTPLNAIIGYGEIMMEETAESEDKLYYEDVHKIVFSAKHLLQLINELLDLSKIEAGKMEVHVETINIDELIQEIRYTFEPLARQRNNKLKIECASSITTIQSDLIKVRQILINILGNACKFTGDGVITIKIQPVVKFGNPQVEFNIRDTGIGINPENLKNLFDPFTQEDNSSTRNGSGTGLGLSISQRLSELLGGSISVESTKGRGSSFTVTLPSILADSKSLDMLVNNNSMVSSGN